MLHQLLDAEMLAEIKRLHFYTRKLANEGLVGQYRSAFRGRGVEFEEVREYAPGDDISSIDWKVTARTGKPFIKCYREERELSVMLACDVSASTYTGTRGQLRARVLAQLGALFTLVALANNDKVGLVTYSDRLETYHPPRKARGAVWRILHEMMGMRNQDRGTDLAACLSFLNLTLKRSSVVFFLSDFNFSGNSVAAVESNIAKFEVALGVLAKRHDVTAVRVKDFIDSDIALSSQRMLLRVVDPETGQPRIIDTGDIRVLEAYRERAMERELQLSRLFARYGVSLLTVDTVDDILPVINRYFAVRRGKR